jgi:hypothetical protein
MSRNIAEGIAHRQMLNIHHPLANRQRSTDDVMVRILYRETGKVIVEWSSPGRAAMMLVRYSRTRNHPMFLVEEVSAQ